MELKQPDIKEIRAIADWANVTESVRELTLKYGDVELHISRNHGAGAAPAAVAAPVPAAAVSTAAPAAPTLVAPAPVAPASSVPTLEEEASAGAGDVLAADEVAVVAPMVGIFYAAPKPGAPAFVQPGDRVEPGTVMGIVEVMKLMNNIESHVSGTVTRILAQNEEAVEYGQALVVIKKD